MVDKSELIINFEGREAKGLSKGRYDETFAGEDGSRQNVGPDLGQNCLKGLSADDNVISRFNAKKNTSIQLQLVITSKVSNSLDP